MSPSNNSVKFLKKLRLGELEKKILDVASELGEFTLSELCERLKQHGVVNKDSVYHAVSRLVEKGLLERVKKGVFRYAGDRFTNPAEDRFRIQSRSIQDRMTDRFRIMSEDRRVIDSGSHADRFRILGGEVKDEPVEGPRGEGNDKSTEAPRGATPASPMGELRGLGKDKPSGDRLRVSSMEATKATSEREVVQATGIEQHKTPEPIEEAPATSSITTTPGAGAPVEGSQRPLAKSDRESAPASEGVGGLWAGVFMVHRLVFGFGFAVLPHLVYSVFPGGVCREVRESGQLVCRDVVGRGRVVTFEFNVRGSGGLVFLEASDSPLSVGEFLGFVDWYLLQVFRRLAGRDVSRSEFTVKAAPHLNVDLPGAYLEGVKSITLQDYYDEVVRKYLKRIDGETYTRVEVEAKSWVNNSLDDVVNGLVASAKLPVIASKLEKISARLEEIVEGGLSGRAIAEAVKADLANLIYAFYLKVADILIREFAPAIAPEIGRAVKESVVQTLRDIEAIRREQARLLAEFKRLNERVEKLARENAELKRRIEEYELAQKQVKFDDLPGEVKQLLRVLEESGLIRAKHERVEYGGAVWKAIYDYKGNIDYWLSEKLTEVLPEVAKNYMLRRTVVATIKAILHYDNRYGDKPGVPYALWLRKLEEYLKPFTMGDALKALREHFDKKQKEREELKDIEEVLMKRLEEQRAKQQASSQSLSKTRASSP
jgi:predicted transcriptional regulator